MHTHITHTLGKLETIKCKQGKRLQDGYEVNTEAEILVPQLLQALKGI